MAHAGRTQRPGTGAQEGEEGPEGHGQGQRDQGALGPIHDPGGRRLGGEAEGMFPDETGVVAEGEREELEEQGRSPT